jgi:Protein of unknown function (DUF2793)
MTDSIAVFSPLWRCEDANGATVSGAKLKFYDSGTTTPKTVYADSGLSTSLGTTVTCDSGGAPANGGGTKTLVYAGTAAYKLVITTAADVALATYDAVRGAIDTSGFSGGGSGTSLRNVTTKTADFTVAAPTDLGKVFNCDPTGGTFTATLVSSVTAADGFPLTIRHDGSANQVKIATLLGQYIKLPGGSSTAGYTLTGKGHSVDLVADGGGWLIVQETQPLISHNTATLTVASRLSTPPASPTGGARYILTGTPTGAWVTYAAGDVVEADGQGGWIKHTPATDCGWQAFVKDEDTEYQFRGSAWVAWSNVTAPAVSYRALYIVADEKASGTNGGTSVANAWTKHTLNTEKEPSGTTKITGASLASDLVTLPTGKYRVRARSCYINGLDVKTRWKSTTTATVILSQNTYAYTSGTVTTEVQSLVDGYFEVTGTTESFELDYYLLAAQATFGLGHPMALAATVETYAHVVIEDLSTAQGPQGNVGAQGSIAATPAASITFANGANSNVVIGTTQFITVTGPTGAFSISGFVAPTVASTIFVYNATTQNMTITNDATSTAANRILTLTGADVALTGTSMATFIYSTVSARWILQSTQG